MRRKPSNNSNKSYLQSISPVNLGTRKRQSIEAPSPARFISLQKNKEDHDLEAFKQLLLRLGKSLVDGFFTEGQLAIFRDYLKEIGKQGNYILSSQNKFNDQYYEIQRLLDKWDSFGRDFYEIIQMSESNRRNIYIQYQMNQFISNIDNLVKDNQEAFDNISLEFNYYHDISNLSESIYSLAIDFNNNSEKLKNTLQKLSKNLTRTYYPFFNELLPNISERDEFILNCCSYIQNAEKACNIEDLASYDQDAKKTFDQVYDLVRKLFEPLLIEQTVEDTVNDEPFPSEELNDNQFDSDNDNDNQSQIDYENQSQIDNELQIDNDNQYKNENELKIDTKNQYKNEYDNQYKNDNQYKFDNELKIDNDHKIENKNKIKRNGNEVVNQNNDESFASIFDKLFMSSIHDRGSKDDSHIAQGVQYEVWLNKNVERSPRAKLEVNRSDPHSNKSYKKRNTLDSRIAIEINQIDNRLDSSRRASKAFKESIDHRSSLLKSRSNLQIQLYKAKENAKKEIAELKDEIEKLRSEIIHANVYDSDVGPTIDPRYTEELRKMYNETNTEYVSNLVELRNKLNQDFEDELEALKTLNKSIIKQTEVKTSTQEEPEVNNQKENNNPEIPTTIPQEQPQQNEEQVDDSKKNEEEINNSKKNEEEIDELKKNDDDDEGETLKLVIAKRLMRSNSANNLFDRLKQQNEDENSEIDKENKNNSSVNSTSGNKFKNNSDYQNLGSDYEQNEMNDLMGEDQILSMGNKSSSSDKPLTNNDDVDIAAVPLAPLNISSSTTSENMKNQYTINSNEMSSDQELTGKKVIKIQHENHSEEEMLHEKEELAYEKLLSDKNDDMLSEKIVSDKKEYNNEIFEFVSVESDTGRLTEEISDLKAQLRTVNNHCFSLRNANRMKTHISLDSLNFANSNNSIVQIATELVRTENQRLFENLKEIETLIQDEEDRIQLFLSAHPRNLINASQTASNFLTKRLDYLKSYIHNNSNNSDEQQNPPSDNKSPTKVKNLQIHQISDEAKEVFINLEKARNNFNEIVEKANYLLSDLEKIDNGNKKKINQFISNEMQNHLFVIRMSTENARIESELKTLEEESIRISRRFGGVPIGKGERKALFSVKKTASLIVNRNHSRAMDAIKNFQSNKQ